MSNEILTSERDSYLTEHSIFLFDEKSSARLALARMKLGLTQAEFAKSLGVSQQTLSDIEAHRLEYTKKITVLALQVALGKAWRYVVFGQGASLYNENTIRLDYWHEQFAKKGRSKPK